MIAFSILSEDMKQIQVWKPRKKDTGFFGVFKNIHFCIFLLNFFKKILICYSQSPTLEHGIKF